MAKEKNKRSKALRRREKEVGKPAVVFSFDGTIMDTEPAIFASYREMFWRFGDGRRFTEAEQEKVLGRSSPRMLAEFFPDKNIDEIIKAYREYQHYHLSDLIQPMRGAPEFLKWLKAEGYPVAIISSRPRSTIVSMLEHAGMIPYVDVIVASSSKEHEFSGSEALLKACRIMKKKCCIYVGHTAAHVMNGHIVGAFTVAFNSNRRIYEVIEAGPDFITADFKMMRRLLESEPYWLAYEIFDPNAVPKDEEPEEEKKPEQKLEKKLEKKLGKKLEKKLEKELVRELAEEAVEEAAEDALGDLIDAAEVMGALDPEEMIDDLLTETAAEEAAEELAAAAAIDELSDAQEEEIDFSVLFPERGYHRPPLGKGNPEEAMNGTRRRNLIRVRNAMVRE